MNDRSSTHEDVYKKVLGKKLLAVDNTACNVVVLVFDDGVKLELQTEYVGYGIYGIEPMLRPAPAEAHDEMGCVPVQEPGG